MSKRQGQNHKSLRARMEGLETQLPRKKQDSVTAAKGVEEDLEKSQLKYLALLESITDAFVSVDREWRFTYINEYGCKLMGKTKEELLGRVVWEVFPDFPENVYAGLHLSLTQNVPAHLETYNEQRKRWYEIHSYPSSEGLSIFLQDMKEPKRAESVVQARLRMLVAANRVSMSIDEFLQVTLDEIEAQTGSTIGFYHFLEADQETLSLQNWSTNTVRNMCTAEGKGSHYPISKAGVWVDCVHERRPVIHNNYASLPHRKGMPPGHAPVIREMVVPIFRGDRIVAIIGVGNSPTDYDASDIEIASLLGDFSWEIVERKKAEEALREKEGRYRSLFENMLNGYAYCRMLFEDDRPQDFIYLEP